MDLGKETALARCCSYCANKLLPTHITSFCLGNITINLVANKIQTVETHSSGYSGILGKYTLVITVTKYRERGMSIMHSICKVLQSGT